MANGKYYSIDKVGADIWGFIENERISIKLSMQFRNSTRNRDAISCSVKCLIAELLEKLILSKEGIDATGYTLLPDSSRQGPQFEEPVLSKYTDMEELLLLDPIHGAQEQTSRTKAF